MISSNELKEKSFSVVQSGYDVDEVNFIIAEATDTIDALTAESDSLYHKLEVLANKVEEYRADEDSIKATLITAQKMADKMKKESNEAATALITKSEETAKETMDNANAEADRIITSAREFSSTLIAEKTEEADKIVADAQKKANDAINSANIVAQDILDQAKQVSEDLISKSKAEKEAYEILTQTIKTDAKSFVEKVKAMYTEQLEMLNGANFDITSEDIENDTENVASIQEDVDSLMSEIDEIADAIPQEIEIKEEITPAEPVIEEIEEIEETPAIEDIEEIEEVAEEPVEETEFVFDETDISELQVEMTEDVATDIPDDIEEIVDEEEEYTDPMEAVAAFSRNEITPINTNDTYIPVIDEEPQMEEKSLFDTDDASLPFESYFNVKTEDAHADRSKTISLVPPEDDDDEPKFKGFFKKKK